MARQVLENGVILPAEYSDDWYDDMTSNLTKLDDVIGSDSEKLSSADVGAAALSNNYNDLDNLPSIPTVNDATLTIQKNGVDVQTFTANSSSNVTANITVPTKTSDITNDSNFVDTSNSAVSSGITSAKVTDYDTHIADTDIHVTTADKTKWNNGVTQSYVFRYSSTALVASSTNSNALLDNTDNLKVGDKVIDSSGVLFSITAIDTANSTFTIGTALVDLATDSDVMHLSGNETAGGQKTFSDMSSFQGSYLGNEASANARSDLILESNRDTHGQSGIFLTKFRQNKAQGAMSGNDVAYLSFDCLENSVRTNNGFRINFLNFVNDIPQRFMLWSGITERLLGVPSSPWSDVSTDQINGLNPSSLGMPDLDNGIDISSYITTPNAVSTYTPVVNGWVSIVLKSTSGAVGCFVTQGDFANGHYSATSLPNETEPCVMLSMPVIGGIAVNIYTKGANAYLYSAKFFPCQGNV